MTPRPDIGAHASQPVEVETPKESMEAALDVVSSWALQRFSLWGGWPEIKITHKQRRGNVKLLLQLAFFSRRTHDTLGHTAEFASSRLAAKDARNATPAAQRNRSPLLLFRALKRT